MVNSDMENGLDITDPKIYIYRAHDDANQSVNRYEDHPKLKITVPEWQQPWRYRGTIVYTLYDIDL